MKRKHSISCVSLFYTNFPNKKPHKSHISIEQCVYCIFTYSAATLFSEIRFSASPFLFLSLYLLSCRFSVSPQYNRVETPFDAQNPTNLILIKMIVVASLVTTLFFFGFTPLFVCAFSQCLWTKLIFFFSPLTFGRCSHPTLIYILLHCIR